MCVVYSQVLEMVATTAPEVFTDWKRQSAELHIARLFQVNMQKLCHQFYQPRTFSMCANCQKICAELRKAYQVTSVEKTAIWELHILNPTFHSIFVAANLSVSWNFWLNHEVIWKLVILCNCCFSFSSCWLRCLIVWQPVQTSSRT